MLEFLVGTDIKMYDFVNYIGLIVLFIFNFTQMKLKTSNMSNLSKFIINKNFKFRIFGSVVFFAFIELLLLSFFQGNFIGVYNVSFSKLVGSGVNYFGTLLYGPLVMFLWFYIIGVNPLKEMDLITPAYSLKLVITKIACFCAGCCSGFECSWGLYFPSNEAVLFPAQLLEAFVALILFVFLLVYRKKAKEGTMFPIYLITYSATRFFTEFTREEDAVFSVLKLYHILCIAGVLVGALWLFVVKKYSKKIIEIYEDAPFPWIPKNVLKYQRSKTAKNKVNKNGVQNKSQSQKNKSKIRMWVLVWSLGLMGQIGWNVEGVWFNTFVYEKIDKNPSIITPMLILSAIATTVSVFLLGTLSDRTGRRRTLISTGYMLWGILTIIFGLNQFMVNRSYILAIVGVVIGDMLVSFFGSMSTDVGYAAWTTDIMKDDNKGKIGAAIAVQCVLGSLLGNIIGGYIVGSENNYLRLFIVVGSVLFSFGVVSAYMFTKKDDVKPSIRGTFKEQFISVFDFKNLLKQKELLWVNIAVVIFFVGFVTYFPHLGNYLIHYLGFSANKMGLIQAIPLVLAMIVTLPVSNFINKDKFVPVSVFSIVSGVIGAIFMFPIMPDSVDTTKIFDIRLFLGIFFLGASYVVMLQSTKIWTKKLYPKNSKGQYEGLGAICYAFLPMTFGSVISQIIVKTSGYTVENYVTGQVDYIPDGKIFLAGVIISTTSIIPVAITNYLINQKHKNEKIKGKK